MRLKIMKRLELIPLCERLYIEEELLHFFSAEDIHDNLFEMIEQVYLGRRL